MDENQRESVRDPLEELLHELIAINAADRTYILATEHSFIDSSAWEARRMRVSEILRQFNALTACSSG
jgi:hypothetical protein